jgi:peptidoglycan hydrolase-like protein with peptidoglycan-binding domain
MKIKILTAVFLLSFVLSNSVYALTHADVDFLIAGGFIPPEKVEVARLAASQGTNTSSTANTTSTTSNTNTTNSKSKTVATSSNFAYQNGCLKLSSDLGIGMGGSIISALQDFLKTQNLFSGESTGYFGTITQTAVENFQKAQGIILNGDPVTTGFGKVGPTTRKFIEDISCGTASATSANAKDFFGQNLNELLNYTADTNYSQSLDYSADLSYQVYTGYNTDLDYEVDFDYDSDFGYEADTSYSVDLNYGDEDPVSVLLFAKAVNGQHLRGGTKIPVAVSSRSIELKWTSENADTCYLNGDFTNHRINDVPVRGTANLTLSTASFSALNGDPMYSFRVTCSKNEAGILSDSDTVMLWVSTATTTPAVQ